MNRTAARVAVVMCCVSLIAPPAAAAQTGPQDLVLLSPNNEKTFQGQQGVTFRVQGQPDEPAGSLHIELGGDQGENLEYDADGLYDPDFSLAGTYELEPVEPGSDIYTVTVPASRFEPDNFHQDQYWFWHAYRTLPQGSCDPDCYQETEDRVFIIDDPWPYLADEPANNKRSGASPLEEVSFGQGFLEARADRDWYRFRPTRRTLRLDFDNAGCNEHCAGRLRASENGDMVVALYAKGSKQSLFKRRVNVGDDVVLRADVRRDTVYFLLVRRAKSSKPAAENMEYGYWPNNGNGV